MAAFTTAINKSWQDLATNLEQRLVGALGIPAAHIATWQLQPPYDAPEVGSTAFKRVCLRWTNGRWPETLGFGAEFDLETGELKEIGFADPQIIQALARSQGKRQWSFP
jgi:hypothetical protein